MDANAAAGSCRPIFRTRAGHEILKQRQA
jgi:hypothetical protein